MTTDLENWYQELPQPQRDTALVLRDLIRTQAPHLTEALKWKQPCFIGNALVCYIQKAKGHVALGFGQGAVLPDPNGVLQGTGAQLRHVKILNGETPDDDRLGQLIRHAIKADRLGDVV